jgi:hypothetical protein
MHMNKNRSKNRWIINVVMYAGFTLMFFLDLTGVIVHQWLGLAVGVIALYHLMDHWDWVDAVSKRYFGKTSWQARLYYLVDAGILLGFLGILVSGLGISTWFSILVENQVDWIDFHVVVSAVTLLLIVIKVIAHRRWIVKTASGWLSQAPAAQKPQLAVQPVKDPGSMDRRDFLKLAGVVGAAAVVALLNVADSVADAASGSTSAEAGSQSASTQTESIEGVEFYFEDETQVESAIGGQTESTVSETTSSNTTFCRSCRKGKHCSFPGECRDYRDSDGNGLCDLGECA